MAPQTASEYHWLMAGPASIGLPGTNGFPAELLLVMSALFTHFGAGLAALVSIVLGAGYLLGMYRRAFFGSAGAAPP
jgi:NADH-quinone oxidoreductase subunit M